MEEFFRRAHPGKECWYGGGFYLCQGPSAPDLKLPEGRTLRDYCMTKGCEEPIVESHGELMAK